MTTTTGMDASWLFSRKMLRNSNPSVEDLDNAYTITYYPDPSNHNEDFRKINIEIVSDVARNWRVRCSPGYRPRSDSIARA